MLVRTLRQVAIFTIVFAALCFGGCKQKQKRGPAPMPCGGLAHYECPITMYCDLGKDCGGIDTRGVCRRKPAKCPTKIETVCDCDGRTYANSCFAHIRGSSVAKKGACEEDE